MYFVRDLIEWREGSISIGMVHSSGRIVVQNNTNLPDLENDDGFMDMGA